MNKILSTLSVFILCGCGSSNSDLSESTGDTETLSVDVVEIQLIDPKDGCGMMNANYKGMPYTGVVENFQGYLVAEHLKDSENSLRFTSGFSYYADGLLDSVFIPYLQNERRYFNKDNKMDSIYTAEAILHFENEILIKMTER
jgi:hypothetical protein|tara:strand:- start:89 stop:517 length:429 start_codon:yes stop_codon:yes gene_type:complete